MFGVGQAPGLKIKINYLFFLIIPLAILTGTLREYIAAFLAIILHETGHILTAVILKITVSEIELLPIGLKAKITTEESHEISNIMVYLSGPFVNLLLFFICVFIDPNYLYNSNVIHLFTLMNLCIAVINLLPVIPLDGGMVLREIIKPCTGLIMAGRYVRCISYALAFIMMI